MEIRTYREEYFKESCLMKHREILNKLRTIVEKYDNYQVADSESPSAPDTSKFIASHSGHLSCGVSSYSSCMGNGENFYVHIGSNIKNNIHEQIINDVKKMFDEYNTDGERFSVNCSYGTNYCPIRINLISGGNRIYFTRQQCDMIKGV
jgi:hypothetical protein